MNPLCFVLMPFGLKPDMTGRLINFDDVYRTVIVPAIQAAELDPIRADEEGVGGSIHKAMFERLMLCEYAVADLTISNANVFYELGIRHAFRPRSTTIIFAEGAALPFDVAPLSAVPYRLDAADQAVARLTQRLVKCREPHDDSPIYQLLDGIPRVELDHSLTDVFRDRVEYSKQIKGRLARARALGKDAGRAEILAVRAQLGKLENVEAGVILDIYMSLRAVAAYQDMLALFDEMPVPLQRSRMVCEQRAMQMNRLGRREEAERVLLDAIKDHGASPETNGLLGRVYKDLWDDARKAGRAVAARGYLKKAIDTYLKGFESDWRDAYPGINAVTLMEMTEPPDPRQEKLLPVVRYAVERRVATSAGDYWDHATLLELAVLARDRDAAESQLADAVALAKAPGRREIFAPETTARNLGLIAAQRASRGENQDWLDGIIAELTIVRDELAKGE